MSEIINRYAEIIGQAAMDSLVNIAKRLKGKNSACQFYPCRRGSRRDPFIDGPAFTGLGLDVSWEVIEGDESFFNCTKMLHNTPQGMPGTLSEQQMDIYAKTNARNAERLKNVLQDADYVFIHDPQPAALINSFPQRKGKWVWRCHIDVSSPNKSVWQFVKKQVSLRIRCFHFLTTGFRTETPSSAFLITPSIDPLAEKKHPS